MKTRTKPRVTLLCGFLGAGKTTLLQHLLTQAAGRRWAVVVNDVAALNLDGAVLRAGAGVQGRDLFELGQGCVCCSLQDDLAETVAELAATGSAETGGAAYEHILVETTGVAEPRNLANLFVRKNRFGRSLSDFAVLSALISVVDAAAFLRAWPTGGRREVVSGVERPLVELMVEQVECADLLIVNKVDLVSAEQCAQVQAILRGLNAQAEILTARHAQVDAGRLLDTVRFDPQVTLKSAQWIRALNAPAGAAGAGVARPGGRPLAGGVPSYERHYGLRSWVYQARRPFARDALQRLLAEGLPGLVRAKGFFWWAEQPDEMGFVSLAGGIVRYDFLGYWWAALIEHGRARWEERPAPIQALWREPGGDRRQELVFIGVGLDEAALRAALDACLK